MALLIGHAQCVADDAIFAHDELMTQDCWHAELHHQRRGELLERVAEDDHLRSRAQGVEKIAGTVHRRQSADDVGDQAHRQTLLVQDLQPALHQHVVVGLVASRAPQCLDTSAFGDSDPDLGHQHALKIEGDDRLLRGASGGHGRLFFTVWTRLAK